MCDGQGGGCGSCVVSEQTEITAEAFIDGWLPKFMSQDEITGMIEDGRWAAFERDLEEYTEKYEDSIPANGRQARAWATLFTDIVERHFPDFPEEDLDWLYEVELEKHGYNVAR